MYQQSRVQDICIIDPCRIRAPTDFIYDASAPAGSLPLDPPSRSLHHQLRIHGHVLANVCSSFCPFRQFTFIAWRMRCLRAAQDVPPLAVCTAVGNSCWPKGARGDWLIQGRSNRRGLVKFTPVAVLHPANFSCRRVSLLAAKFIMKLERTVGIGQKG